MEDRASPTAVRTLPVSSYLVENHFFELCYFSLVALGTLSWYAVGVHATYCSFIKDSPFSRFIKQSNTPLPASTPTAHGRSSPAFASVVLYSL